MSGFIASRTAVVAVVASALFTSGGFAQSVESPTFETFARETGTVAGSADVDAAPGVSLGYSEFVDKEIDVVRPFGDELTDSRGQPFAPINEFAGQAHPYEPGLIGEALGRVKRSIVGSFDAPSAQ